MYPSPAAGEPGFRGKLSWIARREHGCDCEHGLPFVSCCFETRERTLRFEEEGRSASKASHAGIIRIGFEGISQPHLVEHPCFNNLIETLSAGVLQMR
jgi:hypothetical protein